MPGKWRGQIDAGGLTDCASAAGRAKNVVGLYYPRFLPVFLALSALRILVVHLTSPRAEGLR